MSNNQNNLTPLNKNDPIDSKIIADSELLKDKFMNEDEDEDEDEEDEDYSMILMEKHDIDFDLLRIIYSDNYNITKAQLFKAANNLDFLISSRLLNILIILKQYYKLNTSEWSGDIEKYYNSIIVKKTLTQTAASNNVVSLLPLLEDDKKASFYAIKYNQLEMIKSICTPYEGQQDSFKYKDFLYLSLNKGNFEIFDILFKDYSDKESFFPNILKSAAKFGRLDIFKKYLSPEYEIVDALRDAVEGQQSEMVKYIIDNNTNTVSNNVRHNIYYASRIAVHLDNFDILKLIPFDRLNIYIKKMVITASKNNNFKILEYLLHYIEHYTENIYIEILDCTKNFRIIKHVLNLCSLKTKSKYFMDIAIPNCNIEIINFLTPLVGKHLIGNGLAIAVKMGILSIVDIFIPLIDKPIIRDKNLWVAVKTEDIKIIKKLLPFVQEQWIIEKARALTDNEEILNILA